MPNELYWLWLAKAKIGAITKIELLQKYEQPEKIFQKKKELKEILTKEDYQEMCKNEPSELANELEEMKKHKIKMITIFDEYYPQQLRYI